MSVSLLKQNIAEVLGITHLSPDEQASFLSEVGDVIFETSLVRLASGFSDAERQALEQYLETEPEPDVLLAHLLEHYPSFKEILDEAVLEFKADALHVLEKKEADMKVID